MKATGGDKGDLDLSDVFWAAILIGIALLAGRFIRNRLVFLQRLFMPSSVVAGVLVLLLGPQVLGAAVRAFGGEGHLLAEGLFPSGVQEVWEGLPSLLISVVFAALFLGKTIPGARKIWRMAGPQVSFGQVLAWGQYVVGIGLALLVLGPFFGIDPMAGALIEIGFEGGHGTAAGLSGTFSELGFAEGADIALGLATVGLVLGVVVGTIFINYASRKGIIKMERAPEPTEKEAEELCEFDEREPVEPQAEDAATDPLSIHLGLVGLAIALGWLLQQGLIWFEEVTWVKAGGPELLVYVPLFPMAMIGGIALQVFLDKTGHTEHVDRHLVNHISGAAMDLIIVAALGTISLTVLGDNILPFLILAATGLAWNVTAFLLLAPRLIPEHWFVRGLGDFGQSTGMTVTGLLLMRISDPDNRTGAMESFGYKQLFFEPIVGGGIFTAASVPLIAQFGPVAVLLISAGALAFWLVLGFLAFGRHT
jgi:glutamate:Na+ symporter, ESS family